MMELDVRYVDQTFDRIRCNESGGQFYAPSVLRQHPTFPKAVEVSDDPEDIEGPILVIETEEHARNLIKALHKVIDLGWLA